MLSPTRPEQPVVSRRKFLASAAAILGIVLTGCRSDTAPEYSGPTAVSSSTIASEASKPPDTLEPTKQATATSKPTESTTMQPPTQTQQPDQTIQTTETATEFPSSETQQPKNEVQKAEDGPINWQGFTWEADDNIKRGPDGAGDSFNSRQNVWADSEGLHLKMSKQIVNGTEVWTYGEVLTKEDMKGWRKVHGVISGDVLNLDPRLTIGLFTFRWNSKNPNKDEFDFFEREFDDGGVNGTSTAWVDSEKGIKNPSAEFVLNPKKGDIDITVERKVVNGEMTALVTIKMTRDSSKALTKIISLAGIKEELDSLPLHFNIWPSGEKPKASDNIQAEATLKEIKVEK